MSSIVITPENIQQFASCSQNSLLDVLENSPCTTDKGAISYSIGNHDPRVLILTKFVRGIELCDPAKENDTEKYLEFLLSESWKVSPLDTLKLIFYTRDCRKGKGEKLIFRASCRWLMNNHSEDLHMNLKHIPFYGTWKDPLQTFGGTLFEHEVIQIHATKLQEDIERLNTESHKLIDVGAAKFAPSEGCSFDKKWKMVSKFAKELGVTKAHYRKNILRPLRSSKFPIVEEMICSERWNEINFSSVPSIASKKYKNVFRKHCSERYAEYLKNVMEGKEKINTSVLTPVDLIQSYLSVNGTICSFGDQNSYKQDETTEAQWKCMLENLKSKRNEFEKPVNILPIIDVSGSMFSGGSQTIKPIHVSLGVGLIVSLLNDGNSPFFRKWITFSETPKMETLQGETLCEIMKNLDTRNWNMTTNFQSVFDMILDMAKMFSVPQENMPSMLLVISDMQFDEANSQNTSTNWEEIERKYSEAGYTRPTLVFWNAQGNTLDMPVPHSNIPNCCLIGGYSTNILDPLLDGIIPSPILLMKKIIDNPRYDRIQLASEVL